MFKGSIQSNGECEVIIPKTKNFLSEGSIGSMRLEVIADDVYFEPWASDFSVVTNKKVTVQIAEQEEEKPKVQEQKKIQRPSNVLTKEELIKKLIGK